VYRLDLESGQEEVLVPNTEELAPRPAGISEDGEWLYIRQSGKGGSMNANGVPPAAYNLKEGKLYSFYTFGNYDQGNLLVPPSCEMFSLANGRALFRSGAGRNHYANKEIVVYDCATGAVAPLSPADKVAGNPHLSPDGTKAVYPAFDVSRPFYELDEETQQDLIYTSVPDPYKDYWDAASHQKLYVTAIDNPEPKAITPGDGTAIDSNPRFLSDNRTVVFTREDKDGNVSLWAVEDTGEDLRMLAQGLADDAAWAVKGWSIMKYAYTAVFTPEENGAFSVCFPDLPGCYTSGDDITDAIHMAQDVLNLTLYDLEQDKKPIPKASKPKDVLVTGEQFTSVVAVDTETYRRFYENKSVKKNTHGSPVAE